MMPISRTSSRRIWQTMIPRSSRIFSKVGQTTRSKYRTQAQCSRLEGMLRTTITNSCQTCRWGHKIRVYSLSSLYNLSTLNSISSKTSLRLGSRMPMVEEGSKFQKIISRRIKVKEIGPWTWSMTCNFRVSNSLTRKCRNHSSITRILEGKCKLFQFINLTLLVGINSLKMTASQLFWTKSTKRCRMSITRLKLRLLAEQGDLPKYKMTATSWALVSLRFFQMGRMIRSSQWPLNNRKAANCRALTSGPTFNNLYLQQMPNKIY